MDIGKEQPIAVGWMYHINDHLKVGYENIQSPSNRNLRDGGADSLRVHFQSNGIETRTYLNNVTNRAVIQVFQKDKNGKPQLQQEMEWEYLQSRDPQTRQPKNTWIQREAEGPISNLIKVRPDAAGPARSINLDIGGQTLRLAGLNRGNFQGQLTHNKEVVATLDAFGQSSAKSGTPMDHVQVQMQQDGVSQTFLPTRTDIQDDIDAIHRATSGFGTSEGTIFATLLGRDAKKGRDAKDNQLLESAFGNLPEKDVPRTEQYDFTAEKSLTFQQGSLMDVLQNELSVEEFARAATLIKMGSSPAVWAALGPEYALAGQNPQAVFEPSSQEEDQVFNQARQYIALVEKNQTQGSGGISDLLRSPVQALSNWIGLVF